MACSRAQSTRTLRDFDGRTHTQAARPQMHWRAAAATWLKRFAHVSHLFSYACIGPSSCSSRFGCARIRTCWPTPSECLARSCRVAFVSMLRRMPRLQQSANSRRLSSDDTRQMIPLPLISSTVSRLPVSCAVVKSRSTDTAVSIHASAVHQSRGKSMLQCSGGWPTPR